MARNVIFLIHGVGQHAADWADIPGGPAFALREAAKGYSYFKDHPLDEAVEFIPIRYDDLFDRILKGWADAAKALWTLGGDFSPMLGSGIALLAKADAGAPAVAVGGDVPLYRGFALFRQRILMRLISSMASTIAARTQAAQGTPVSFHVIAHSLGTTVAHDAINALGTESWPVDDLAAKRDPDGVKAEGAAFAAAKATGAFKNGSFRFGSLFQVSNTSGLLYTTAQAPTASIVRPGQYLQTFLNVDHKFDPISKVGPFLLPETWAPMGIQVTVDHIHELNIHSYAHYLSHPDVHLHVFKQGIADFTLDNDDKKRAKAFPKYGPDLAQQAGEALQGQLDTLLQKAQGVIGGEVQKVQQWVELYREFLELTKGLAG